MADEQPVDEGGNRGEQDIRLHEFENEEPRPRTPRRVHFDLSIERRRRNRRIYIGIAVTLMLSACGYFAHLCSTVDCGQEVKRLWNSAFYPGEEPHAKIRIPKTVFSPDPLHWRHRASDHGMPRILLWNPHVRKVKRSITVATDMSNGTDPETDARIADCAAVSRRGVAKRCEVAHNRDLLKHSDAVVFQGEHFDAFDLPPERTVDQTWVFWIKTAELPYDYHRKTSLGNRRVNALFNWTMAYRDDADVRFPRKIWRFRLSPVSSPETEPITYLARRESAALIVGACNRDHIIDHFAAFPSPDASVEGAAPAALFHLHTMLECGAGVCASLEDCVAHVAARYHFIFIFKSPDCFTSMYDVIHEAFKYDLVPVVLGPPDATLDVPPHSVVSSGKLEPLVPLSSHLQSILDDPQEYESFFSWKKDRVIVDLDDEMCPLCIALWERELRKGVNGRVKEWLDNRTKCHPEDPLYGLDPAFLVLPPV